MLGKETRPGISNKAQARRYVLGLSLGPSSTVLLHLLNENVEFQVARGRKPPFELVVVHVDSSCLYSSSSSFSSSAPSQVDALLAKLREEYPRFTFQTVPLAAVLDINTIDWSALPTRPNRTLASKEDQLRDFFNRLPTVASRTDLLRLFTRHLLVDSVRSSESQALLLGHSTTALAELTLSETAKGRGFSLPWMINDGPFSVLEYPSTDSAGSSDSTPGGQEDKETGKNDSNPPPGPPETSPDLRPKSILIYHPLRDILRKELVTYTTLVTSLADLITPSTSSSPTPSNNNPSQTQTQTPAIVSHKDLSIEEVMTRYFADVEENYPSVVANVARTTGKLVRLFTSPEGNGADARCGVCGMPVDEQGDERWRGELGIVTDDEVVQEGGKRKGRICYGCERSTRG